MGANLFLVSSSGLDTGSSIDLSPGETMVWNGDNNITDIDCGFNGDAGTYSFGTTGGPGAFTSTNTSEMNDARFGSVCFLGPSLAKRRAAALRDSGGLLQDQICPDQLVC